MTKRILLAGAITLLGTLPIVGFRPIGAPANTRANGVWVCHFPSHEGDFVTFNAPPNTIVCDREGANALYVAHEACWSGHQAAARFGKDCDTEDQD